MYDNDVIADRKLNGTIAKNTTVAAKARIQKARLDVIMPNGKLLLPRFTSPPIYPGKALRKRMEKVTPAATESQSKAGILHPFFVAALMIPSYVVLEPDT